MPLLIALGLALALVVGVLVGAKLIATQASRAPYALSAAPAPLADSAECAAFTGALPKKLAGNPRATLAEPAPAGAAAYVSTSQKKITVRCGVDAPLQFTELSELKELDGVQWLRLTEPTTSPPMESWFSVNTTPIVAVTGDEVSLGGKLPHAALQDALSKLPRADVPRNPLPLVDRAAPASGDTQCSALLHALPDKLGTAYRRATEAALPAASAAWVAEGQEPVVLRCGVADAPGYAPGARLTQVNNIPWFEDTTLSAGTNAKVQFALGREVNVAVSMPAYAGNAAIVGLSESIAANTRPKR